MGLQYSAASRLLAHCTLHRWTVNNAFPSLRDLTAQLLVSQRQHVTWAFCLGCVAFYLVDLKQMGTVVSRWNRGSFIRVWLQDGRERRQRGGRGRGSCKTLEQIKSWSINQLKSCELDTVEKHIQLWFNLLASARSVLSTILYFPIAILFVYMIYEDLGF